MQDLRVVYMGTPDFSLKPLEYLIQNANVVLVVTKKDAEVGRKKILTPSPVKILAQNNHIPVFTPSNLKKEYQTILDAKPDIIITCAYGKIVPKVILDYPKYGCLNIHASLLPKYRGSSPIQYALLNGDKITGVTLMYMDEFMDTGDIIATLECEIEDNDDVLTLHHKLSKLGCTILEENLEKIVKGENKRFKQLDKDASYAPMIEREMESLDFNENVRTIYNKVRAFSPFPLTKTMINGEEVKVIKAHYELGNSIVNKLYVTKDSLGIGAIDGILYLDIIKPIGKKEMNVKSYLNGKKELFK